MEVLDTSIANVALPYIAGNLGASNGSEHLGPDLVPRLQCHHPAHQRLARNHPGPEAFFHDLSRRVYAEFFALRSGAESGASSSSACCKARAVADCSPWLRPSWPTPFLRNSEAWRLPSMALPRSWHPRSGQPWADGSPSTIPGGAIFFINLPVGVLTLFLVRRFVEDPPYLSRLKSAGVKLDYIGIALLTLGIGALQVLLDKGQEDDWFGSHFITTLIVTATVCLISLAIWEWFHKSPIIDVRMFRNFNFASASLMMFMLGIMLFSSLVLMPQFLQTLLGYTSQLAGLALSAGGLVLLIEMPIMGQLTTKIQARRLIAFLSVGWLCQSRCSIPQNELTCRSASVPPPGCASRKSLVSGSCSSRSHWWPTSELRRKEQRRRRNHQFHAQHGQQCRNFPGHNINCPALAYSIRPGSWSMPVPAIPISRIR